MSLKVLGRLLQTCRAIKDVAKPVGALFLQEALCYRLEHNDVLGREALWKAALCGNSKAMFYLAVTHFHYHDWNFNFAGEVAQYWFRRSARAADPHGMIWYAYYLKTFAMPSDKEEEQWEAWVQFALATKNPFVKGFALENHLAPSLHTEALLKRTGTESDTQLQQESAYEYYERGARELDDEFCWLRVDKLRAAQMGNRAAQISVTDGMAHYAEINFDNLQKCDTRSKHCYTYKELLVTCKKCNSRYCRKCYSSHWVHSCI
jgi:hypothetical protein